jgi:GGDEF domain-containing protein
VTLHLDAIKLGNDHLVNTVLVGANPSALGLIPQLAHNPQLNLVGILPTHPDDLIHHLDHYGYQLASPCSIEIYDDATALAQVENLSLIIDAGFNPGTVRALTDAGLDGIPRINPAALDTLMQRPTSSQVPSLFPERLAKEVGRAYRHGRSIALMLFNAPDSDPSGHGQQHLIRVLEQSLRLEDVVATLPNGQIAVILPETGENTALVASRLTSNLTNNRIRQGAFGAPPRRYSVGWAWFPQDAKTAPALMEQAKARITPV